MQEFNRKQLTIIFKIAFLEAMALSIIMPSVTSSGEIIPTTIHDTTPLGIWPNMPFNTTELLGNTSYRGLIITASSGGESGIQIGLIVNCINPSNTIGALLNLQYANYSDATHTNTSNFLNPGIGNTGMVPIDNSINWPCPGLLEQSLMINLPAINSNPVLFEIRVVGSGGGGIGDNPRFGAITVYVNQRMNKFFDCVIASRSTTSFNTFCYVIGAPVSVNTIVNFDWIATNNGVLIESGANTCTILALGTNCSVITTFAQVYVTVPNVVATTRTPAVQFSIQAGSIDLLRAQTLTV